jgi:hypothetical protein
MECDINIEYLSNECLIQRAKKDNRDYSHFHPSEWDRCHRQKAYAYYETKGIIKKDSESVLIDARLQRLFDNGHFVHARWRSYLESTGAMMGCWECLNYIAHKEPKIYGQDSKLGILRPDKCECGSDRFSYVEVGYYDEETMWGGHVDAILDLEIISSKFKGMTKQSGYIIVDFKSINSRNYSSLKEPKPEHITQMQIYLYLAGLDCGKFVYENKDNQTVKEYVVKRDDVFLEAQKQVAKLLKYRIQNVNSQGQRVLPPRGYPNKSASECMNCKFKNRCW